MLCTVKGIQKAVHWDITDDQGTVSQGHTPGGPGEGTGLTGSTAQRKLLVPYVSLAFEEEDHFMTHQNTQGTC